MENDFLKQLFTKQIALQKRVHDRLLDKSSYALMTSSDEREKEYVSNWNVLALHAELSEFLEWTNWKMHKTTRHKYDDQRLYEMHIEIIDMLHYIINLCIIWGLSPEVIVELYNAKNAENHRRQDSKY